MVRVWQIPVASDTELVSTLAFGSETLIPIVVSRHYNECGCWKLRNVFVSYRELAVERNQRRVQSRSLIRC
jgi:hypothetical protein